MRRLIWMLMLAALAACAAQESERAKAEDQAVRDFIEVRGLEELDKLRSTSSDSWQKIAGKFIVYETRRDSYLVEFARRCHELDDNTRIVADERWDSDEIRARFETIRGCRIHKIYALSEADATELKDIGEAPGRRN